MDSMDKPHQRCEPSQRVSSGQNGSIVGPCIRPLPDRRWICPDGMRGSEQPIQSG